MLSAVAWKVTDSSFHEITFISSRVPDRQTDMFTLRVCISCRERIILKLLTIFKPEIMAHSVGAENKLNSVS
jgi:hypothetical protein